MAKYRVEDIRNIALVGHGAAGKTSLADTLLFQAKAVDRRGSVDEGTSVSDYDDEEKKRHFSIDTSVLHLEHKGKKVLGMLAAVSISAEQRAKLEKHGIYVVRIKDDVFRIVSHKDFEPKDFGLWK